MLSEEIKKKIPTKSIIKNRIPIRDYKNILKIIHDMIERDMKSLLLVIIQRRQGWGHKNLRWIKLVRLYGILELDKFMEVTNEDL